MPPPAEVLYPAKSIQPGKRYIGRASHTPPAGNHHEYLWCIVADVSTAIARLTPQQRHILRLRYQRDLGDLEIAKELSVPVYTAAQLVYTTLDTLADVLDGDSCSNG